MKVIPHGLIAKGLLISFVVAGLSNKVDAQVVRLGPWGGISIRGPGAAIDVGPFGGSIRAAPGIRPRFPVPPAPPLPPFPGYLRPLPAPGFHLPGVALPRVGVDAQFSGPAHRWTGESAANAALRTTGSLQSLEDDQLLRHLQQSSDRLAESLQRRDPGQVWSDFLRPHDLVRMLLDGESEQADEMLRRYEGVRHNRELAWVENLGGFTSVQEGLREWLHRQADQANVWDDEGVPPDPVPPRLRDSSPQPLPTETETETIPPPKPDANRPERFDA